ERLQGIVGQIEPALLLFAECVDLLILHLRVIQFARPIAGVDIEPVEAAFALVGLFDGRIEDPRRTGGDAGDGADITADTVAAQQADDGILGNVPAAVGVDGDARTGFGRREFLVSRSRHESKSFAQSREANLWPLAATWPRRFDCNKREGRCQGPGPSPCRPSARSPRMA